MQIVAEVVLWLFIVFLGIAFGAGVYETRIEVASWRDLPPAEWTETGRAFWAFVTTGPLTLLTLLSLVFVWQVEGSARTWWLFATGLTVVERASTFAYFIPTMVRLQSGKVAAEAAAPTLDRWTRVNLGRHLLNLAAWLSAMAALAAL